MENDKEVKDAIGQRNFDLLFADVKAGRIKYYKMKLTANKMHPNVHGIFEQHKGESLEVVWFLMMDQWYNEVLYKGDRDGCQLIKDILEDKDVGLHALSKNLQIPSLLKETNRDISDRSLDEPTVPLVTAETVKEKKELYPRKVVCCAAFVIFLSVCLSAIATYATSYFYKHGMVPTEQLESGEDIERFKGGFEMKGLNDVGGPSSSDVQWIERCPK